MYVDSPSVDIACEPTRPWSDMSSYTFSQKLFRPTPPERGSFPLDHEGVPQLPYGPQPDGSRGLVQARLRRRPAQRDIDLDLVVDQLLRRLYCPRRCLPDRVVVGTQAIASRILLLKADSAIRTSRVIVHDILREDTVRTSKRYFKSVYLGEGRLSSERVEVAMIVQFELF
ncbi:PREDICTED: uncharacterized protein LOC106751925 isoform X2 [Dinoponera quadriceps]|uniref:Uncharacterized protein LOC106751925 isoform X2 n=1 Tax=Dinoponera quadriceps TaxID=609295 RepID=A0A6P3YCD5_DINQU|nr:PREDICTED: uncharacterized protein LOC106751925 isoform X2 [Dinoponera quadriceps]